MSIRRQLHALADDFVDLLEEIGRRSRGKPHFEAGCPTRRLKGDLHAMLFDIELSTEEVADIPIQILTRGGAPAQTDGPPMWSQDSGAGSIQPAADGLKIRVVSPDALSDDPTQNVALFTVKADADLDPNAPDGGGIEEISAQARCTFVHPRAASFKSGEITKTLKSSL